MEPESVTWLISGIRNRSVEYLKKAIRDRRIDGLNTSHSALLSILYGRGGELPMKDIVEGLGRNKSTVTEMVKSAEKAGFVTKRENLEDKRAVVISLTERARSISRDFEDISLELIEKTFTGFSDLEKVAVLSLLEKIYNNLE